MNKVSTYDKALKTAELEPLNKKLGYKLFLQAHEEGDGRASYVIATWYLNGLEGVLRKNIKKALPLLKEAMKSHIAEAAFCLAICYETGRGVRKSEKKAFELYTQAAFWGDVDSYHEINRMYYHGIGVKKNIRLSDIWYEKAKELGYVEEDEK